MENVSRAVEYISLCANASDDGNITSEFWLVEDKASGLVFASFLLLFLVVGLPWNLLVVVTIVKEKLYTQPTSILLLNLAISDLILLVLHIPFQVAVGIEGEYNVMDSDYKRCQACNFGVVNTIFQLNILSTIALMSVDRFLFIYKPLKYDQLLTVFRALLVLALTWILNTVLAILPAIGYGNVRFSRSNLSCTLDNSLNTGHYVVLLLVYAVFPLVAIVVFNIWLSCIVMKNIRAVYNVKGLPTTSSSDGDKVYASMKKKRHQKQLHLVRVFGGLLCVSFVTWSPGVVLTILNILGQDPPKSLTIISLSLFSSQVILHPFVETVLIKDVRKPYKKIALFFCMKIKAKLSSADSLPSSNRCVQCGCYGNKTESSWPPGCSGCGFLEICNAAFFLNHPQSSTTLTDSRQTNRENPV